MLIYINTNLYIYIYNNKVPVTRAIYLKLIFVDSADCQVSDSMHKCLNFRYQQETANALYSLQLVKGQYGNISVM